MLRDQIKKHIDAIQTATPDAELMAQALSFIDLTSLNSNDTPESIAATCQKAVTAKGVVAAVCVYPEFLSEVKSLLKDTSVKIATVANFPYGEDDLPEVLESIRTSIAYGANEMDVVFPYPYYLDGERGLARDFVEQCRLVCGKDVLLKVILEVGVLKKPNIIADAAKLVLDAGADFIKTSTGKIEEGATLEAAAIMLLTIKEGFPKAGLKVSGGVRTIEQLGQYVMLAKNIMGASWVSPKHFRIGASQLVDALL